MERRVLISYAADDPDWTPEQVEAVASAIEQAGIRVHLDRWHQRDRKRRLSLAEWQTWMDASIDGATHILCLVSARYRALWARDPAVPGGYGVAFESTRLIHHLYLLKQHNDGRILTLRPDGHGYDCIPRDLALDCPEYRWVTDLDILLSYVGEADLPAQVVVPASVPAAPARQPAAAPSPPPGPPIKGVPPPAPVTRPAWASASGMDGYGHWADLTVNGATQRMRWIAPSGPEGFWMGSTKNERDAINEKVVRDWANEHEHEPRRVEVKNGFWLADTPCTQAFWEAVTDENPSHFRTGRESPERPVENVSWNTLMGEFIAPLAARLGWGAGETVGLPREEEWEYAARAGTRTAYWWGDAWDAGRGNANIAGQRRSDDAEGTTPVKRHPPNPWGLYDVHGNVWERCSDVWLSRRDAPEARPDEDLRVVRGGSWIKHPGYARAACRAWQRRWIGDRFLGFRFVLRSPVGPEAR